MEVTNNLSANAGTLNSDNPSLTGITNEASENAVTMIIYGNAMRRIYKENCLRLLLIFTR